MSELNSFGISFSIKYADELGIDPKACLAAALRDLGVKRLRLMSYWGMHEPKMGKYDFKELDWQFRLAKKYGAKVSLAVGLRQPRWPESHWPSWAQNINDESWQTALLKFIELVVVRYKDHPNLESWQLENEALLMTFGQNGNFDRKRLQKEYNLVKNLDGKHPIIMTMSDSWGLPIHNPRPNIYAISVYRRFYDRGKYRHSRRPAIFYKLRGAAITLLTGKQVFIHELQAEPWGPTATSQLDLHEQAITMNAEYLLQAAHFANQTGLMPAYLWGAEWWYWLLTKHGGSALWESAQQIFSD